MSSARKLEEMAFIEPESIECSPLELDEKAAQQSNESMNEYPSDEVLLGEGGVVTPLSKDVLGLSLKGAILFLAGPIYIIKYSKEVKNIFQEIFKRDFTSILKRSFKNTSMLRPMKKMNALIERGRDFEAIDIMNDICSELETIDDYDIRADLLLQKAALLQRNGLPLAASYAFMESGSLVFNQVSSRENENGKYFVTKAGEAYLLCLRSLGLHIKEHGLLPDHLQTIKDISQRAEKQFQKEAQHRSWGSYYFKKTYEINLGGISIPIPTLCSDNQSEEINKKFALEARRIQSFFENKPLVQDLCEYIESERYRDEKDDAVLLETVDDLLHWPPRTEYKNIKKFLEYVKKRICNDPSYPSYSRCIFLVELTFKSENSLIKKEDLLKMFKFMDEVRDRPEVFVTFLAFADRISTNWDENTRHEFIELVYSKDYPHLPERYRIIYEHLLGISRTHSLSAIYPKDAVEFEQSLQHIACRDHFVISNGRQICLSHEDYIDLLSLKAAGKFGISKMMASKHRLSPERFPRIEYQKYLKVVDENFIPCNELELLIEKINREFSCMTDLSFLKERVRNDKVRIGVFGLTKVGKSTFLNALFKRVILKVDKGVATNVMTKISYSEAESVEVTFKNGHSEYVNIEDIQNYTSEQYNPGNEKRVLVVAVSIPWGLSRDLEIVDIPGFGASVDNFAAHEKSVEQALDIVDGAFLLTTPSDGLKSFEINFAKEIVNDKRLPFCLILNKWDDTDEDEREDVYAGISEKLRLNEVSDSNFSIMPVSSQLGLAEIEEVEEGELLGFSRQEAVSESNISGVRAALNPMIEQVFKEKSLLIRKRLTSELLNYKAECQATLRSIKEMQEKGLDEIHGLINHLNEIDEKFKTAIKYQELVVEDGLISLHSADLEKIAQKVGGQIEGQVSFLDTTGNDYSFLFSKCEQVWKLERELLVGKLLEYKDTINDYIQSSIKDGGEPLSHVSLNHFSVPVSYMKKVESFSRWDSLSHKVKKLIMKKSACESLSLLVLKHIHLDEIDHWEAEIHEVRQNSKYLLNQMDNKIKELNALKNYSEKDCRNKTSELLSDISKINDFLLEVGETHDKR